MVDELDRLTTGDAGMACRLIGGARGTPNCWIATGHFRNGILLAPATGLIVGKATCLQGETPAVELAGVRSRALNEFQGVEVTRFRALRYKTNSAGRWRPGASNSR